MPAVAGSFALALALAPAALATVRYVSPSGLDSNSGTSASSPWSLAKANASLVAGDVCMVLPGTYGTGIAPANSGTSGSRITYVGNLANPAQATVAYIDIAKAYITVKGVASNGAGALNYPARYDSIARCVIGDADFFGAKYSTIARCTINGTVAFLLDRAQTLSGTSNCEYDTLRGNTIDLGSVPSSHGFKIRGYTQNCLIDSNRVVGTFTQTGTNDGVGRIFYNSSWNTLRDNFWKFDATNDYNSNPDPWNGFVLRDSASHYLFERDTLLLGVDSGTHEVRGVLCSSGSFPGSVGNNRWNQCVIRTNSYLWVQNGLRSTLIENSVIASRSGNALWFGSAMEGSQLRHNTLWAGGQVMRFDEPFLGSGNEITSNIIYSTSAGPVANYGCQTQYASNGTGNFAQNNNLFFTPSFTSSPGDRSLMWCCYTGSKPGSGTPWSQLNGQDVSSRYGSPMFVDSTWATLDVHLTALSRALGVGLGGTDAGAYPFGGGSPDVTPPAAVADLAAGQPTDQALVVTWTAPGDDGSAGTVAAYDLRYSTAPITAANFASASTVTVPPAPLPAGSAQNFVLLPLQPGTTYYVALKARDEAGNWSTISNVASGATGTSDTTPPAAIHDLR